MNAEPAAAGVPTDEDVLVAVEEALEGVLLPDPGFRVLEAARNAVLDAVGPLVARLRQAPAVPVPPPTDQTALRDRIAERPERYAVAIHDAMESDLSLVDQEPGQQALFARAAEAVMALADSEQATLRRKLAAAEKIRENADFHLGQEMARRQLAEKEAARLSADQAAVLNAAAQHLYTALFPAVYDDMGQKAAEGVNRAVSELRRLADEAQQPDDGEGDELVCVDECGCCDACGFEPFDTPAEGWREAARFLRRTARDSGDRRGVLHGARLIEAELRRLADESGPCVAGEQQNETPEAEVVHGCPPDGSGLTPCCGRTPFELPLTDRISSEAPVTCPGKETDRG